MSLDDEMFHECDSFGLLTHMPVYVTFRCEHGHEFQALKGIGFTVPVGVAKSGPLCPHCIVRVLNRDFAAKELENP